MVRLALVTVLGLLVASCEGGHARPPSPEEFVTRSQALDVARGLSQARAHHTSTLLTDGSVLVAGTVRLDELGQHFGFELMHDEVDSVSGVVLAVLGRPPAVGDVVVHDRVRIEVTAVSGRGVRQARATQWPRGGDLS